METAPDRSEPMITRVTVSYRLPGDPTEHEFTIEHTGEGAAVDAVSWSGPLMKKIVYREGSEYREPELTPGKEWRVTRAGTSELGTGTTETSTARSTTMSYPPCIWIHYNACMWQEVCSDQ
jgi:hypothetical protein